MNGTNLCGRRRRSAGFCRSRIGVSSQHADPRRLVREIHRDPAQTSPWKKCALSSHRPATVMCPVSESHLQADFRRTRALRAAVPGTSAVTTTRGCPAAEIQRRPIDYVSAPMERSQAICGRCRRRWTSAPNGLGDLLRRTSPPQPRQRTTLAAWSWPWSRRPPAGPAQHTHGAGGLSKRSWRACEASGPSSVARAYWQKCQSAAHDQITNRAPTCQSRRPPLPNASTFPATSPADVFRKLRSAQAPDKTARITRKNGLHASRISPPAWNGGAAKPDQ